MAAVSGSIGSQGSADLYAHENKGEEENKKISLLKKSAQNEDVIARLHAARERGLKIGIFAGRREEQSVPQEEGWIWCSLDRQRSQSEDPERMHLDMNFNNPEDMQKIQGLFDKVLLDISTVKFMRKPWMTLQKLLVKEPHATVIVESGPSKEEPLDILDAVYIPENGAIHYPMQDIIDNNELSDSAFSQWKKEVGKARFEAEYRNYEQRYLAVSDHEMQPLLLSDEGQEFLQGEFQKFVLKKYDLVKLIDRFPGYIAATREYLQGLFQEVALVYDRSPYFEDNSLEQQGLMDRDPHWILRNPL
jgi:hypothetical protein